MDTLSLESTSTSYQSSLLSANLQADPIHARSKDQFAEEKRIRRLIRNREAAKRNRLKKKEWINGLQNSNSKIIDINANLASRIIMLQEELSGLQTLLLKAGFASSAIPTVKDNYVKISSQ